MNQLGYYGKTVHRGDFVRFNLPQAFVRVWDDWLQQLMIHGENHCQDWADIYAQAPTCRFMLSGGIAGNTPWIGLLRPSQDKVGRRFPFCLAMSLPEYSQPCLGMITGTSWFDEADALLDRMLADARAFDEAQDELMALAERRVQLDSLSTSPVILRSSSASDAITISMSSPTALLDRHALAVLLDTVLRQTVGEYSLWVSSGSTQATIVNDGMPLEAAGRALFTGDWTQASSACIDTAALLDALGPGDSVQATMRTSSNTTAWPASSTSSTSAEAAAAMPAAAPATQAVSSGDSTAMEGAGHADFLSFGDSTTDPQDDARMDNRDSAAVQQIPSADDWAALEDFEESAQERTPVMVPEIEPLELDEDDLPDAPWER